MRIKSLRIKKGLTQLELSEGICSQSQISRIEQDKNFPSTYIIEKFASRLNVSVDYLYSGLSNYHLEEYKSKVYDLVEQNRLKELALLLSEHTGVYQTRYEEKLIFWIKAIISDKVDKDKRSAIRYIKKACNIKAEVNDPYLTIHILNSFIIIQYGDLEHKTIDDIYNRIIDIMEKEKLAYKMSIKILLSIATYNFHKGNIKKVYTCSKCAVDILDKSNSNYYLDYHLYHLAASLYHLNKYDKHVHEKMLLAKQIAFYKSNMELYECITNAIIEIEQSLSLL